MYNGKSRSFQTVSFLFHLERNVLRWELRRNVGRRAGRADRNSAVVARPANSGHFRRAGTSKTITANATFHGLRWSPGRTRFLRAIVSRFRVIIGPGDRDSHLMRILGYLNCSLRNGTRDWTINWDSRGVDRPRLFKNRRKFANLFSLIAKWARNSNFFKCIYIGWPLRDWMILKEINFYKHMFF